MKTSQSKFIQYCGKCHYTIWKNEYIMFQGSVRHLNCVKSLVDPTPRKLDPRLVGSANQIDKQKLINTLRVGKTRGLGHYTVKTSRGRARQIS